MATSWRPLGDVPPRDLLDARVQAHYAVQLVAAVGASLVSPEPDASHKSFVYAPESSAVVGRPTRATPPFRAALRVPDLTLELRSAEGAVLGALPLQDETLAIGLAWMNEAARRQWPEAPIVAPHGYDADFPGHPVGTGAAFHVEDAAHLAELDRYYANTHDVLAHVRRDHARTSPATIWPHHFDVATLIRLGDGEGESARTVGVGLSPGDGLYDEPYWYVSPWPYPDASRLPSPEERGSWRASPWFGAVLTASELLDGDPDPEAALSRFLEATIPVAIELLG
ncbi:MAG: hypothetical protein ACYTG6_14060 [Planctomycetota bacterium]|jgi:hypothetical protein